MPSARSTLTALGLVALTGCGPKVECKTADLAQYAPTLAEVPAEARAETAMKLLAQACPEPAGLAKAFGDWRIVPPDQRPRTIGVAAADHGSLWKAGCPGGEAAFEALVSAPAEKRGAVLFEQCDMARFGWVTAETVADETAMIGLLYAPVLDKAGVAPGDRDPILKALILR